MENILIGVIMKVYLIDRHKEEIKQTYDGVISWRADFVEYLNRGCRSKIYCDLNTEYFTDGYNLNA